MPEKQNVAKILNKILRVIGIVVYIGWFIFLLAYTVFFVFAASMVPIPLTETDTSMGFHPELIMAIISLPVFVLQLETALVLLRKNSRILGIIHAVLSSVCFIATLIFVMNIRI